MMGPLQSRLLGTWSLVSYRETPVAGGADHAPLGLEARGMILYTHDGYVSAQLMRAGRAPFAAGDWFAGTDAELREASDYIGYTGRYHVDEEAGTLTHGMDISFFPNWLGQTQGRALSFHEDELHLGTVAPILSRGMLVMAQLRWRRP